jgi:hypothetical protein
MACDYSTPRRCCKVSVGYQALLKSESALK